MKTLVRFFIALPILLVVAGCDFFDGQTEINFETIEPVYSAGDQVDVKLENNTRTGVGLNLCFISLERQVANASWESTNASLGPAPYTACNADMQILSSGKTTGGVAFLSDDQLPGLYSIVTDIEIENNRHQIRTNVFEVQ